MAIPFRRISNVADDTILQQFQQKTNVTSIVSPSNKENFPISTTLQSYQPPSVPPPPAPVHVRAEIQVQRVPPKPSSSVPEIGIRFAEPYTPQNKEFHPVPILMGIEFVEVCTGPPWSVGDSLEIQRRKEIENYRRLKAVQDSRSVQSHVVPTYNLSNDFMTTDIFQFTQPTYPVGGIDNSLADLILSTMTPSPNVFEYSRRFTHVTIAPKVSVPLTYVRAKIPEFYTDFFLDDESATHILHVTSVTGETASVPIHDLVLVAQCLEVWRLVTLVPAPPKSEGVDCKPGLFVENVPHLDAFAVLLRWLYTHDEDELYDTLEGLQLNREELLLGFAQNCQFWGVIDTRVQGVVRTILEGSRDMIVPSQQYVY